MDAGFWHGMWEKGEVGFHQEEVNEFLLRHWLKLNLQGGEQVLVPLCGKSLDMLWLATQGHEVLGVELSEKALKEFLVENNLIAQEVNHNDYCGYQLDGITLLCGDFFKLSSRDVKKIQVVYDRAALVALPLEMRQRYVRHLIQILPVGTQILLVVMEYNQEKILGPPFSVSETEVYSLFADTFSIEKLEDFPFQRKSMPVLEKVFKLVKQA